MGALLDDVVSYAHGGVRCFGRPLPIKKEGTKVIVLSISLLANSPRCGLMRAIGFCACFLSIMVIGSSVVLRLHSYG